MKLITFVIPCYNSAEYMDTCIKSVLVGASPEETEVIIVDDGSTKDDTLAKAQDWEKRYPDIIRAIHQENGGHGEAVNCGIRNATGMYFKVVDSDDHLDAVALPRVYSVLRRYSYSDDHLDMMICNYIYERLEDQRITPIRYRLVLPEGKPFGWSDTRVFFPWENLLMHSVIYRTQVLRDSHLELPKHTFYVDNIFVYVPLPHVERLYYLDADLYHYYIGREDQSVNEKIMASRIDQQLLVTRFMIDAVKIPEDVPNKHLEQYMVSYLTMMMTICSVFAMLSDRPDHMELRDGIWQYLKNRDQTLYYRIRGGLRGIGVNLPGDKGPDVTIAGYRAARKIFNFN